MEEVVEVGVRNGLARLSPGELLVPALEGNVHAARVAVRANVRDGAVDEVDEVLLRDGAATLLPCTVADDLGVDLQVRGNGVSARCASGGKARGPEA